MIPVVRKYQAEPPLTDEQSAEILRLAAMWERDAQHNLWVHLTGEAKRAEGKARMNPAESERHLARAEAFREAITWLDKCWPTEEQRGLTPTAEATAEGLTPVEDKPTPEPGTLVQYHGSHTARHGVWKVGGVVEYGPYEGRTILVNPDDESDELTISAGNRTITVLETATLADLPPAPGAGDEEVWIPPASDCLQHRPDKPCPHCAGEYHHMRTGRCSDCGRRPSVVVAGE